MSPPRRKRGGERSASNIQKRQDVAVQVVYALTQELGVDFLALGEVGEQDVDVIRRSLVQWGDLWDIAPETPNGIASLYRRGGCILEDCQTLTTMHMGHPLKRCLYLSLQLAQDTSTIHLFVLHWPSSMPNQGAAEDKRSQLAQHLREFIDELPEGSHVVVLGDFNVEPFDSALDRDLRASRDRTRVRKKSQYLLYNPFWRLLGEQQHLHEERDGRKGAGTCCFSSSGRNSQWYTVDQILLSASLLDTANWHPSEDDVAIWQDEPLLNVLNVKTGRPCRDFDHFPVVGALRSPLTAKAGTQP